MPQVAIFLALGAALGPAGLGALDVGLDSPALHIVATLSLALILFTDALTLDLREARRAPRPRAARARAGHAALGRALRRRRLVAARFLAARGRDRRRRARLDGSRAAEGPAAAAGPARRARATRCASRAASTTWCCCRSCSWRSRSSASTKLEPASWARLGLDLFLLGPGAGVLVGVFGLATLDLMRRRVGVRRDYESLYSLGIAFAAFAAAESVHGSGFLAAFAAGLTIAALRRRAVRLLQGVRRDHGGARAAAHLRAARRLADLERRLARDGPHAALRAGSCCWRGRSSTSRRSRPRGSNGRRAHRRVVRPARALVAAAGAAARVRRRAGRPRDLPARLPRGAASRSSSTAARWCGSGGAAPPPWRRRRRPLTRRRRRGGTTVADPELITIAEVRALLAPARRWCPSTCAGTSRARRARSRRRARGALSPQLAAADARRLGLPADAWLVAYCTCPNEEHERPGGARPAPRTAGRARARSSAASTPGAPRACRSSRSPNDALGSRADASDRHRCCSSWPPLVNLLPVLGALSTCAPRRPLRHRRPGPEPRDPDAPPRRAVRDRRRPARRGGLPSAAPRARDRGRPRQHAVVRGDRRPRRRATTRCSAASCSWTWSLRSALVAAGLLDWLSVTGGR